MKNMIAPKNLVSLTWIGLAMPLAAGWEFRMEEIAGNVVVTGSGVMELADGVGINQPDYFLVSSMEPANGLLDSGAPDLDADSYAVDSISGPADFGDGTLSFARSSSGSPMGFSFLESEVYVPDGYTSADGSLNSTSTYEGQTLEDLGVSAGTYSWTLNKGSESDTIELTVVPEPATALLLGVASASALLRRRRMA